MMWFFGGNSDHSFFFQLLPSRVVYTHLFLKKVLDCCSKFVILLDSNDKNISFAFLFSSSFSSFSCYLDDIFSAHALYILPYSIHDIYVRLCHFRWTAFYLCSTLMGCYTIYSDCWYVSSAGCPSSISVFRQKVRAAQTRPSVECLGFHLYSKPSQATSFILWQQQKNGGVFSFSFPCAQ